MKMGESSPPLDKCFLSMYLFGILKWLCIHRCSNHLENEVAIFFKTEQGATLAELHQSSYSGKFMERATMFGID